MILGSVCRTVRNNPSAWVGGTIVILWVGVALLAPWLAPFDPNAIDAKSMRSPIPSSTHLLGVDHLGRDILSRIIWGARAVLTIVPPAVGLAYLLGVSLGLLGGYYRGWVDFAVTRITDVLIAFPVIVLYVVLITTIGPSVQNILIAICLASGPYVGRIVRSAVISEREKDYISAAKLRGESGLWIMCVEILPNIRNTLVVDLFLRFGYAIVTVSLLGFLGLGLPPPDPDWGGMVKDATTLMLVWPHIALFPSIAISSLVFGFNLLADGLRSA